MLWIEILTLVHLTIAAGPLHSLLILLVIIDTLLHAAYNLGKIYALVTHTEILLEEVRRNDRACDAHRHAAHREV